MKDVTINGVSYLPASALAKEFRYTTDYIGQLCRAKKVDAQFIGRSWYVNPLSLTAHKQAKFAKPAVKSQAEAEVSEIKISRLDVSPAVAKITARTHVLAEQNFAKRIDWKPLKYEVDNGELLPLVTREQAPAKIEVDLADATIIAIKTSSKSTNLVPDDLPTVSLKGALRVTSLDEGYTLPTIGDEPAVADVPLSADEIKMINFTPLSHQTEARSPVRAVSSMAPRRPLYADRLSKPALVVSVASPIEEDVPEIASSYHTLEISLSVLSVTLVVCLGLLVFGESSVEATGVSYRSGIDFSTTSLTALVSCFLY